MSPTRGLTPLFVHRGGAAPYREPTLYSRLRLQYSQLVANALSSAFLIVIVIWALAVRMLAAIPQIIAAGPAEEPRHWDDPGEWKKEKLVKHVGYYAKTCGFEIKDETCETQDGYYLRVHRIVDPERASKRHTDGRGGYPKLDLCCFLHCAHAARGDVGAFAIGLCQFELCSTGRERADTVKRRRRGRRETRGVWVWGTMTM